MLRACVVVCVLALAPAAGAAELVTVGEGTIEEAAATYDIHLDGLVGRVTARHRWIGTADAAEAVYSFALPDGAAVVGLTVTGAGGDPARARPVDAVGAITAAAGADTTGISPDVGLVRRLGTLEEGGDVAYEVRVYPVGSREATVVEVTWVAPLEYVDGRLALRIPARGDGVRLADARATVRATAPAGVRRVRDLRAGGGIVAAKPGKKAVAFAAGNGELRVEVTPVATAPVVAFSTAAVEGDVGAIGVALLRPRADEAPSRFARAVFVVDGSTSAAGEKAAREAAARLVEAIAKGLREDAKIDLVMFDRTATIARTASPGDVIREHEARSGTDLVAGLGEAGRLLDEDPRDGATLVMIVTDGIVPSDTTGKALEAALGPRPDVTVSAVLLGPDALALPDPRAGAIAELVQARGGHVVAVRHGEAAARRRTIADEIGAASDWYVSAIRAGGAELAIPLPDEVPAGAGFVAFGWYHGKAPARVELDVGGATLVARKRTIGRTAALAAAGGAEAPVAEARRAAVERASGAAGRSTALVAVDPGDDLAVERLALGARGGTYTRIPPPPERGITVPEVRVADVIDEGARYAIDTAARIRVDLLAPQLLPAARACLQSALGAGGVKPGKILLEIEIARGEVIAVRATGTGGAADLAGCLLDAGYALTVPSYTLTDGPDTIHLIRYPLTFEPSAHPDAWVAVAPGDGPVPIVVDDVATPLGGLESE